MNILKSTFQKKSVYVILFVVFFMLIILNSCSQESDNNLTTPIPIVKVIHLDQHPLYQINEVGTIKAVQEVELVAKAAGTIGSLFINIGDSVSENQVITIIDSDEHNNVAKVNYDNAQIQLSNARQNYNQIKSNNQDLVTRSKLRLKSLKDSLDSLERNRKELDISNASTMETLELELENASKNNDTAQINYNNIVTQYDQSWINLLDNITISLNAVSSNLASNLDTLENIINPNHSDIVYSSSSSSFGARDSRQRIGAFNTYYNYKTNLSINKAVYDDLFPLTEEVAPVAIDKSQIMLEDLRIVMNQMHIMLSNSISGEKLSQATLDSYIAQITAVENSISADATTLNTLKQTFQQFQLDQVTQIATAKNNKIIATNRLSDAHNSVTQFHSTQESAVKDLDSAIQQAKNNILSAESDLDSAERSLSINTSGKMLEINTLSNQLRLSEKSLNDNKIKSSINGVLSELVVDEGDYVSPGTYIGKLIQYEKVKVVFYVSKDNADRINLGQSFSFTVDSNKNDEYFGFINKIYPSADKINKKIRIEGLIDNNDFFLKPETLIDLKVDISSEVFDTSKIYIPINSVIFSQNAQYVFIVRDQFAIRSDIVIGDIWGSWVEVVSGLTKEDSLIVEGHRNLSSSGQVKVNIIQ